MHECWSCGQACDCDGEDLWNQSAAEECVCQCDEGDEYEDEIEEIDHEW